MGILGWIGVGFAAASVSQGAERRIATFFGYLRFAVPDSEEPADPVWRREDFVPPLPPALQPA